MYFDYGSGGGDLGDVFGRVSPFNGGAGTGGPFDIWDDSVADMSGGGVFPGDLIGIAGQNSTAFFAMNDMDGTSAPGFTDATWSFDISSAQSIQNIQIDIAALGDFEASSSDGFLIEAQIDGGGFAEIFRATTDEDAFKDYRPMDDGGIFSDDDPLQLFIDGSGTPIGFLDKSDAASGLFDTYTSTLFAGQSGSTLDIRVSWSGTPSGSEPMGIDNITINGGSDALPPVTGELIEGINELNDFTATINSDDVYWGAHGATFAFAVTRSGNTIRTLRTNVKSVTQFHSDLHRS